MSLCALAFISCQKEEMTGVNPVDGKYTYEFVAYQQPDLKATIGDKVDGKWPVLWSQGDKMGVYKADGTFVGVASLKDESAGQNEGKFIVDSNVELSAGDQLHFSYPYVENAAKSTGKIAAKQTLGTSGVGANAVAYAEVEYTPGNTNFVLNHTNAYIKFNIQSEDFAGYNLHGVTLWATGAELSGDVAIADELTVTNSGDYVKSTLATPVSVSANTAQPVWVTALPGDLSENTVYAIVHMTGAEGTEHATETVTLPVRLNRAGALPAGSVTEITLPSLTKSLAPAWYEPIETRYIAAYGEGWCYGPENTVIFTSYNKAQPVEFKARGNFMKVREPKYLKVKYLNGINDCTSPLGVVIDGATTTTYAAGSGAETFTEVSLKSNYIAEIAVDNHKFLTGIGAVGYISALEVKDADHNTIWGTNLWLVLKPINTIQYTNGKIMDRNLGVDELGNVASFRSTGNYFQWGRPFALQSQSNVYAKKYFTKADAVAVTSLDVSAANPYTLYYYATTASRKDWYYGDGTNTKENSLNDLWGNPDGEAKSGEKSIYDPCPQGYRVVSPAILAEILGDAAYYTTDTHDSESMQTLTKTTSYDTYFISKNAVWSFAGAYTCDGYNSGINWKQYGRLYTYSSNKNPKVSGPTNVCAYWSNASTTGSTTHSQCFYYTALNAEGKYDSSFSRARALPVRCMVDTEDR